MRWLSALLFVLLVNCDSSDDTSSVNPGGSGAGATAGSGGSNSGGSNSGGSNAGGSDTGGSNSGGSNSGGSNSGGSNSGGTQSGGSNAGGSGGAAASSGASGSGGSAGTGGPTAAQLLALVANCAQPSDGLYATDDDGSAETIPICALNGAFFWKADMDIDCDGKVTAVCNSNTDPAFQDQTSTTDSQGQPLDASTLPYVVIPLPSARFDYMAAGLELGAVVAVIYNNKVVYGVFGDEGPENIIGEASYAMATALGIDPDPSFGGTDSEVTYIVFHGANAVVNVIEDHQEATALGEQLAAELIQSN